MINLVRRGAKKVRNDGISGFATSAYNYIRRNTLAKAATFQSPIKYEGVILPTASPMINAGAKVQLYNQDWEKEEIYAVDEYFNQPLDFIDLGSCTGFMTVCTLNKLDDDVTAVAVEANPNLIPVIARTRSLNDTDFEIVDAAYHTKKDQVNFNIHTKIESSSIQRKSEETVSVSTTNIRSLIQQFELDTPAIIADIEGAEVEMICNEIATLEEYCPLLIIEMHEDYADNIDKAFAELDDSIFQKVDSEGDIKIFKNIDVMPEP